MIADAVILSGALNGLWVWLLAWAGAPYGVRAGRVLAALSFGLLAAWLVAHAKAWFPLWALRPGWFPEPLWRGAVEAALLEELAKALVLITTLALLKPRSHFEFLVLGIGLGSGFGLFEDAGYILRGALSDPAHYYRALFSTALARSVPVHAALEGLLAAALSGGRWGPALFAFLAAFSLHAAWNTVPLPFWEKGTLILALLGAQAFWCFWRAWRLYPRFEARWERGWVALLTPWEPTEPQGLEAFLGSLGVFTLSLFLMSI